jgi:5'-nucleotidase / UDP-sugar diphosphatase
MMRRFIVSSLAGALVLGTAVLPAVATEHEQPVEITLLHDSHFHGKYSQTVAGTVISIAEYFALVQERKDALGGNALFLGNGDDIGPSVYSGLFEPNGIHMIDALNAAPIDVNTIANHEFDYGPDNLRELITAADFPFVTANVRDIATGEVFGADQGVEEFVTFDVDGVTVGVTGLAPEGMASITSLGPDTEQISAEAALDIVSPKMRAAGVDVIVVTSHLCGSDATALADGSADVDVIAGDHCGTALETPYVSADGTIVSFAGDEYRFLGELTLSVLDGEVTLAGFTLHDVAARVGDLTPIAAIQEVVDAYDAQLDEQLNVVIGERTVDWDTRTTVIRRNESAAGNYFTDEMRSAFGGSDIAVTNSGGIRGNQIYPAGDITRRQIAEIFPFGNKLVQAEISGAALLAALEHSVSAPLNDAGELTANGQFLQVSGLTFEFDRTQPAGDRVHTVLVGGEPLDLDRVYTMATNDFTLGGGDGYTMFQGLNVLVDSNGGMLLDTFLIQRIEARDGTPITTDVEGRIVDTPATSDPTDPTDPPAKDECKDGGWQDIDQPSFKNQGQCVASARAAERESGNRLR